MKRAALRAMGVLWPSFLVACAAEFVFFATFDPHDFLLFGRPIEVSRHAAYAIGFFSFWAIGAASALGTLVLGDPARG